MTVVPSPRWGVRFTADQTHNVSYLQDLYDNDTTSAKRGELFLNEPKQELYYVGADGVARRAYEIVGFDRIDFTGIREFANDAAAAAATPPIPIGGMYHTAGTLKVRRI